MGALQRQYSFELPGKKSTDIIKELSRGFIAKNLYMMQGPKAD